MLTQAPLPDWRAVFQALTRRAPSDAQLAAPWCRDGDTAGWLSRSTWSLALIGMWRANRAPESPLTVWVPDYFCNSALGPLRHSGARLVFYPLTDELAPDMAACKALLESGKPDLFVLVHYFGRPSPAVAVRDFCARNGAWLVEDAAHVLRPVNGVGEYADFVIYSPHKHLPIPNGAVTVVRTGGPGKLTTEVIASFGAPESWQTQLLGLQQALGASTNSARVRTFIWLVKRLLQKLGIGSSQYSGAFVESTAAAPAAPSLDAPAQRSLARRLLASAIQQLPDIARRRERHELVWDCVIPDARPAQRPTGRSWTPYLAAYDVNPSTAEESYGRWQSEQLPVTTWPDLPPEVVLNRQQHTRAWQLRHSRVYLPVHQTLDVRRMVPTGARGSTLVALRWQWDQASASHWHEWSVRAGRSSLLQSWAYGAARAETSGWRVKRAVVYRGDEPIALVQMLGRRIAGILTVARINRGPVCLRELLPEEKLSLWADVARLGSWTRGSVLSVAPDLELTGHSLALLAQLGFRQFSPRAWESAWVDLALGPDALRKRLDGKWRNMLAAAEKADLKLQTGTSPELFDWMLARHRELVEEKSFAGQPPQLLPALRRNSDPEHQSIILRALSGEEAVGGICLVIHGAAATYLLGWNSPQGRSLKANQFLLWQALLYLWNRGIQWFDLGGLSEELTPGITAFKLGMNGRRYELVGEYWKW
jgi:hypothetical protein